MTSSRSFCCWKSLWFGVLVLGVLGCLWARSYHYNEAVHQRSTIHEGQSWGQVAGTVYYYYTNATWTAPTGWSVSSEPAEPWFVTDNGIFPSFWAHRWYYGTPYMDGYHVAHWCLMLAFAILWSGFLTWRWRRLGILTKSHDPAPAH